jgi:uncharacterized integral membrane protein
MTEKIRGEPMNILILVLMILAVVAIFSVQNAQPVAIKFFFWKTEASLAIVIIVALVLGASLAFLVALVRTLRRSREAKRATAGDKATVQRETK